jgi:hypothetical protein
MKTELTDEQKAVFKAATERRKAAGIRLGRWCVMLNKDQLVSINEFWDSWVKALGKEKAGDYLIVVMRKGHEALREAIKRRQDARKSPPDR